MSRGIKKTNKKNYSRNGSKSQNQMDGLTVWIRNFLYGAVKFKCCFTLLFIQAAVVKMSLLIARSPLDFVFTTKSLLYISVGYNSSWYCYLRLLRPCVRKVQERLLFYSYTQ